MCKELQEDDEFISLLKALSRYESIRHFYYSDVRFGKDREWVDNRIEMFIEKELMVYFRATMDRQTKYGLRIKLNIANTCIEKA